MAQGRLTLALRGVRLLNIPVSGVQCDAAAVFGVRTPDVGPGEEALVTGASWGSLLGGVMVALSFTAGRRCVDR